MKEKESSEVMELEAETVQFAINGMQHTVDAKISPTTRLVDYLRNTAGLTGTKVQCREGGCGACTVLATVPDPENGGSSKSFSIQSCQQLVYACNGWSIETVEHLGDRYNGYHPIQQSLAGFYGTQCGYCSPGMVMTMYGQQKSTGTLTASQVEKSLDGNLCRCTGYRPILDAFKALADDGEQALKDKLVDIEDAFKTKCPKTGECCKGSCSSKKIVAKDREITVQGVKWFYPTSLLSLYSILDQLSEEEKVRIVGGNTGQGVYKNDGPFDSYIDTSQVPEFHIVQESAMEITLGASVSLKRAIEVFEQAAHNPGFQHLQEVAKHWSNVANVAVRNVGTIAGNLMMKHTHQEFPSDLFLTLLAADAQLALGSGQDATVTYVSLEDFLLTDMRKKVVVSVRLPSLAADTQFRSFKITPRAVNAHAYVNAAFRFQVDENDGFLVKSKPLVLYGGINPLFIHAANTEEFLSGRRLTEQGLLTEAAGILAMEVLPDALPQDSSPAYRLSLAQSLLYKAVISIVGSEASLENQTAGTLIERPISTSKQSFNENPEMWPVGKPIPKVEAIAQVAGEATFPNDEPAQPHELHGVFIQASVGSADIKSIDTSEALNLPGVVAVITAEDIPGVNDFAAEAGTQAEEVFASGKVLYAGQGIGLVIAESYEVAHQASELVKVEYENAQKPVLTIKEALDNGNVQPDYNLITGKREPLITGDIEAGFKEAQHVIEGEFDMGFQFHFPLEPMAARVTPIEDGYDVTVTSIWPAEAQSSIAQVLDIDANSINISVRRVGGSFGGKISRAHVVSAAAALGALKTHRPVRVALNLKTFITLIGGRDPFYSKYKVGFDDNGKLASVELDMVSDSGCSANEASAGLGTAFASNVYYCPNWLLRPFVVTTNTPSNTYMRSPGIFQGILTIESIMDHIAHYLGKDPLELREINLAPAGAERPAADPIEKNVFQDDILPLLKESSEYEMRLAEVEAFNQANRWRKRGLAIMPMCFNLGYPDFRFGVLVNIYSHDGSVSIAHGGIELGQGLNTKTIQVASYILGVPVSKIKVKATSTTANANSSHQGATVCSDIVILGVKKACENLRERLDSTRQKLSVEGKGDVSWAELVKICKSSDVDLSERIWTKMSEYPKAYDIWGGACAEVEVDVLTGQFVIRRADLIEDCGKSLSPYMDIGQIEGAFVMGLGFCTLEKVKFNPETGEKLSNGTWEYKPPSALDIPVDLRVTILPNSSNTSGVLRAKATGEPPLNLAFSVVMALRKAITAARAHRSRFEWFRIDTPLTVEQIQQLCLVDPQDFSI
ncbi:indole-3-acetaldehyde oxidase-like [Penaeus japonicus]|uniref:indole-3-acetaldehyde oxidase-like n=1 Tax=Penaeus japonicus TaxID=27405 RepID=UPI001C716C0C|nr:indole-3-acetaldehyde oxidase-like [Penaeus japonicus]XP_042871769.1 indole-3-acetaldehyde oxidase-like [Penaeus japonicus]XP_042871770.1 indole-3-acetaldehyde oxidase-like [Penaeus japonicus]XP_042871771.1 indole-3-acetaldehyde oxidase-like [Penaeus japonicus]XP_042871772.1 indole-3-acetaldehyde oxidase-like [Penaeus japonicus]